MAITLRIVGIFYFDNTIPDLQENGQPHTVETVLDYAVNNPAAPANQFGYITGVSALRGAGVAPAPIKSATAFFANYDAPGPISRTANIQYPAGEYYLSESLVTPPSYRVWQYYVFNAPLQGGSATYLPRTPRIESFTTAPVPANGQVTWRLVDILTGPNQVPRVYRQAFGLDGGANLSGSVRVREENA